MCTFKYHFVQQGEKNGEAETVPQISQEGCDIHILNS